MIWIFTTCVILIALGIGGGGVVGALGETTSSSKDEDWGKVKFFFIIIFFFLGGGYVGSTDGASTWDFISYIVPRIEILESFFLYTYRACAP